MRSARILLFTVVFAIFGSGGIYANGVQSPQAVMYHPPVNLPIISRGAPGLLSSNSIGWDSDTKTTNVSAGASAAIFTFNFTNVATNAITILNVRPSCGCTTVQLPPLPWKIDPGMNGRIGVRVNLAGKNGALFKTVNVYTDKGSQVLSVKINIALPMMNGFSATSRPLTSVANRMQNLAAARVDRQAVFHGDCVSCHVKPGEGKLGRELYDADCAICHEGEHRASMVPDLHAVPQSTSPEFWRTWIAYGRSHSLMPAFAISEGGPLTDAQIVSLADYLAAVIPAKRVGN